MVTPSPSPLSTMTQLLIYCSSLLLQSRNSIRTLSSLYFEYVDYVPLNYLIQSSMVNTYFKPAKPNDRLKTAAVKKFTIIFLKRDTDGKKVFRRKTAAILK